MNKLTDKQLEILSKRALSIIEETLKEKREAYIKKAFEDLPEDKKVLAKQTMEAAEEIETLLKISDEANAAYTEASHKFFKKFNEDFGPYNGTWNNNFLNSINNRIEDVLIIDDMPKEIQRPTKEKIQEELLIKSIQGSTDIIGDLVTAFLPKDC